MRRVRKPALCLLISNGLRGMSYAKHSVILFLILIVSTLGMRAGEDEVRRDSIVLDEVAVVARFPHNEVIPVQRLSGEQLERLNSHTVADALRYFSGLQVKD